jgi:hypothetical protein
VDIEEAKDHYWHYGRISDDGKFMVFVAKDQMAVFATDDTSDSHAVLIVVLVLVFVGLGVGGFFAFRICFCFM